MRLLLKWLDIMRQLYYTSFVGGHMETIEENDIFFTLDNLFFYRKERLSLSLTMKSSNYAMNMWR